ncbi:putative F-box protein At5g62660 isoform X2 [Prosopis cineraria]|uniref:putative F-box protein At5g62660 isoform X2 n=1 Tax=Prosopis cineraria TaxID=364024 RepID=UPI0024104AC8|nr:putative F-box protein At5g62660 isoform X2 [Prosopis cineraria]
MKQHMVMAGDGPFLPEEIIRNILKRLPAKSLIRFRRVCKQWRNLFKTPSFIEEHLNHTSHQNPSLLLQRNDLWLLNRDMQLDKVDNATLIDSSNTFRVVGSSNGLLCVWVDHYIISPSLLLWNPATREVRQVPPSITGADSPFSIGFGFSPIVNDYKIVVTYDSVCPYEVLLVVVYSLSSGSWKEVEYGIEGVGLCSESITVNGAMFWFGFGRKQDTDTYYEVIVSFDIANEVFALISIPAWSTSISRSGFTVYENKLAVLSFPAIQDSESWIELWVMEDVTGASWSKKYSSCLFPCLARPVTIWRNQIVCDGIVVCENERQEWNHEQKISLINITTNELRTFDISKCGDVNGGKKILQPNGMPFIESASMGYVTVINQPYYTNLVKRSSLVRCW